MPKTNNLKDGIRDWAKARYQQMHQQLRDYITMVERGPEISNDIVQVPEEYPEILRAGAEYTDLSKRAGYKRLLDDLEKRANTSLAALRHCISTDPAVLTALHRRWIEAEDTIKFIEIHIGEAIDHRANLIAELGVKFGVDAGNIDAGLGLDMNSIPDTEAQDFMDDRKSTIEPGRNV